MRKSLTCPTFPEDHPASTRISAAKSTDLISPIGLSGGGTWMCWQHQNQPTNYSIDDDSCENFSSVLASGSGAAEAIDRHLRLKIVLREAA